MVASRAVSASSDELLAVIHGGHAARVTPWPCFAPGWVRHPLLFAPGLLLLKMKPCSARASNAGELRAAAMAAPPRSPSAPAARALLTLLYLILAVHLGSDGQDTPIPLRGSNF
jgi:hypothetical protein